MTTPLKVIFAGTPDFAASTSIGTLLESEARESALFTPSLIDPQGEGKKLTASPVKVLARKKTPFQYTSLSRFQLKTLRKN